MKKVLVFFMAVVLALSLPFSASATPGKSKGHGKGSGKSAAQSQKATTEADESMEPVESSKTNLRKQFKLELNAQKKAIAQQKEQLEADKLALEAEYQALLTAGDTAGADAKLAEIEALNAQALDLQSQMKQIINERYMITKTMYSEEELQQFENAAALIEQMYLDAQALDACSMTIKNNLIKLEAPPYIKGGKILVPIRAIEELGATVEWDELTKSVTITKDGTVVVLTANGCAVTVDGVTVETDTASETTCGRAYVPLRFLAETFGLEVNYDEDTDTVDIDDGIEDGTNEGTDDGTGDGTGDGTDGTGEGTGV